jgi:hypothetical protein
MLDKIILLLLFCTACKSPTLSVHSEYYTRQELASYIIDTPDPKKQQPIFGQHITINWNVSKKVFQEGPLELKLHVITKNGEMQEKNIALDKPSGTYIFPIVGKDFTEKGGLLSYKVELTSNGKEIATSKHKLWVDQIKIQD